MEDSSAPPRAKLTIEKLQALAIAGSNNSWLRWWAHWNYPQNPVQMAISMMDEHGKTGECADLESKGFEKFTNECGMIFYICDRIDDKGNPYVSRL